MERHLPPPLTRTSAAIPVYAEDMGVGRPSGGPPYPNSQITHQSTHPHDQGDPTTMAVDITDVIASGMLKARAIVDDHGAAEVVLQQMEAAGLLVIDRATAHIELVGASEVAERTGVSRSQVWNWRKRRPARQGLAPEPLVKLKSTPVWLWRDWEQFLRGRNAA